MNKGTIVCALNEIDPGTVRPVLVGTEQIALVRIDDEVFALADKCSHADVRLSDGVVWCETKHIECARHSSSFSLVTGEPDTLPATQPVKVYRAWVENQNVLIDTDGAA